MAAVDTGDPVSHDDDTTYISNSEVNHYQSFTLTTIPAVGQIDSVNLGSRERTTGVVAGISGYDYLRIGGTRQTVNTWAFPNTTYQTNGPTSGSRPGGGSWVQSDLASLQMGCRASAGAVTTFRCTSLWIVLNYQNPGGLIPFFLDCIIAGLVYPTFQAFASHIAFASARTWSPVTGPDWTVTPDEVVEFWRLHKARRYPRYFDLGR